MKVLITGGSGFIGTNLMLYFISKGHIVINVDIAQPKISNLTPFWKQIDIIDFSSFEKVVLDFDPDYIVQLAARTDLEGNSIDDYPANTIGVKNLMEIVPKLKNLKKIIITSTMLVCHVGYLPINQRDYFPTTNYGRSKVETEKQIWSHIPSCDWAIVRPTSIWGPWFGDPYFNFFKMVKNRRYFHIGNKACTKTYGYIGNVVYQIESILFSDTTDVNRKVFYLGDKPALHIETWANDIARELNIKILKVPFCLIKLAAWFGDFLKLFKIKFPMTSFRLNNMTTDNTIDLTDTYNVAPNPPFSTIEGIKETLKWINDNHK